MYEHILSEQEVHFSLKILVSVFNCTSTLEGRGKGKEELYIKSDKAFQCVLSANRSEVHEAATCIFVLDE
jgi:hypothetical protein